MKPSKFMPKQKLATYLLHSKTNEYKFLLHRTDTFIKKMLSRFKNPYVSVSGGKDSMVLLHLLTRHKEGIPVFHWDYGDYLIPRDIEKEIIQNIKEVAPFSPLIIRKMPFSNSYKKSRIDFEEGDKAFYKEVRKVARKNNFNLAFIGLRRQESNARNSRILEALKKTGEWLEPPSDGDYFKAFPLAEWKARDVWAYIVEHDVPVVSVYNKLWKMYGGDWEQTRFACFFDDKRESLGSPNVDSLWLWRFKNPKHPSEEKD